MSGRVLRPDEVAALAALKTTPGPWSVRLVKADSGRDASVQIVADDGHLATMVTYSRETDAGRQTDMLNAEADGALAAAALDLLATALDLLQRVEAAEEAVEERDAAWEALGVGPGGTLAEAITLLARGWSNRCAALTAERDGARAEVARLQSARDAQRDALRSEVAMLRQALAGRGCT